MGEINLLVDSFSHGLDTVKLNFLSLNVGENKTYKAKNLHASPFNSG
jgi:hypothetical protein